MDFLDTYNNIKESCENLSNYSLEELEDLLRHANLAYKEYDNLQLVIKRNCNSLYGSTGNKHFLFCDVDIAEDITTICRHFAILVDIALNKFFASWKNDEKSLKKIQKFYPDVISLSNLNYVRDTENDICVYGDTDSRYIDIEQIIRLLNTKGGRKELPPNTPEGNEELVNFSLFLDKEFFQEIITNAINEDLEYRNGNKGYLKMAHEVTTRKSVLIAKKMYIMPLIWKDGKALDTPKLKYMGVSLKRGETSPQLKKIIEKLVYKYLVDDYTDYQISTEVRKIVNVIKKKNQKSLVCRSTSVSGVSNLKLEKDDETGKEYYTMPDNKIGSQLIKNWANFLKENNLDKEYKLAFEKQKMYYYKTTSEKYPVIGVPDDVNIDEIPNMPPINWQEMINQQFIKPLMKCIFNTGNDISEEDCNNFITGVFINKIVL